LKILLKTEDMCCFIIV